MNEQAPAHLARPKVMLVGDASARPEGLERALTRAGFQLIEGEDSATASPPDAVLVILSEVDQHPLTELFPSNTARNHGVPPTVVVISSRNPDAPATALSLGASDALLTPIHLPELCARLYARIRERRQGGEAPSDPQISWVAPGAGTESVNGRELAGTLAPAPESLDETLEHRVQEEFERARRYSLSFSLVLLGIDELQGSDERLGAEAATRLRSEVSRTLRRELRVPDLVVPYGHEEFAIVLPETGESGARQSVIRVRERLTSLPFEGDPRLEATRFSAGIVTYPHPAALQPEDLFAMAEAALMRGRAQAIERIGVAV